MTKNGLHNRYYFFAIGIIMVLNVSLAFFLFRTVFTQTTEKPKNQKSLVVEVGKQEESPLLISIQNVDNSNNDFQIVNFTIQNIGNTAIRGYVIYGEPHGGKTITNFFPVTPFQPGVVYTQEIVLERENIKPDKNLDIYTDYVVFTDGRSWGVDRKQKAEHFVGAFAGVEAAVDHLKDLISKHQSKQLDDLRGKRLLDLEVPVPKLKENKDEKWENGFRDGYKSVISFIKSQAETGDEELLFKLNEIKMSLKPERGEKR